MTQRSSDVTGHYNRRPKITAGGGGGSKAVPHTGRRLWDLLCIYYTYKDYDQSSRDMMALSSAK